MKPTETDSSDQTSMPPEEEMPRILLALRDILAAKHERSYAQIMHDLYHDWGLATTPAQRSDLARQILRLYAGMGSFNDIVFTDDGPDHAFSSRHDRLWHLALHFVQ